jgi:hypothetical protein
MISRKSAEELHLKKGDAVVVIIKSTEVMIQKDRSPSWRIRSGGKGKGHGVEEQAPWPGAVEAKPFYCGGAGGGDGTPLRMSIRAPCGGSCTV